MATLTVSLSKPLKEFVDDQIAVGNYGSASAFFSALVQAERKRKAEEKLLALVKEAEESGPATPWTAEDMQRIRREGLKRLAASKKEHHGTSRKKAASRR